MSTQPYEIVAAPFEVYIAPVAEAFPLITSEPPGGNWILIGTSGADNYNEDGVTIESTETVEDFRSSGGTGIRKSFRTEEDLMVKILLHDITLEELARAFDFNTVTTDSNDKFMLLYRGLEVSYKALLVRGNDAGPYGTGYNIQFELPRVRPSGEPELVFKKGEPAGVAVEFTVLEDLSASSDSERFGRIRTQFQG